MAGERKIIQLSTGKPKSFAYNGKNYRSAIGKEPVLEAFLNKNGFSGDGVAHTEFHGGPDRAVCLYPYEHYARWKTEFGGILNPPAFGENITATGMLEADVHIGDIFKIGDAVIQVTQGRIPCATISRYNEIDPLLKRTMETCLTGYFFRVLEEGSITRESKIELLDGHPDRLSVLAVAELVLHKKRNDRDMIFKSLENTELAADWRTRLEKLTTN